MALIFTELPDGFCPCQASGSFDSCPFYFRARHGNWHLNVVKKGKDPLWEEHRVFDKGGDDPSCGWMAKDVAEGLIREAYAEFKAAKKMKKANKV